jgi:hypothetical protein
MCAVSGEHNEAGGIPYYWFALHRYQLEFLNQAETQWICLGCGSAETTLLLRLPEIRGSLDLMSVTKGDGRHYWHLVLQKRSGQLVLRLLGGVDGPDLTGFDIAQHPAGADLHTPA